MKKTEKVLVIAGGIVALCLVYGTVEIAGCDGPFFKKNPPKPANFTLSPRPPLRITAVRETEVLQKEWDKAHKATEKWFDSLVVCLHCGSDLNAKGANVCSECLRPQRPFDWE